MTETGSVTGLTYLSQAAVLDAAVGLRTNFTLEAGADINDYTFTFTRPSGVETAEAVYNASNDRYEVMIPNIAAAYWDNAYTLTVTNTKTAETYTVTGTVIGYLGRLSAQVETAPAAQKTTIQNLCKSMYLYNQAAGTYFNK